ncbi:MAG TPA: hypothetical protein ACFE0H_06215 [Elainellaceae cyanobacterium]
MTLNSTLGIVGTLTVTYENYASSQGSILQIANGLAIAARFRNQKNFIVFSPLSRIQF